MKNTNQDELRSTLYRCEALFSQRFHHNGLIVEKPTYKIPALKDGTTSPAHLHAHSRFSSKRFGRPNASVLFWRTLGIQIALLEHRHWNKCDRFANSFTIDSTICRSE